MSKIISGFSSSNSIMLGATRMNLSSSADTWEIVIRAQVKSNDTQQMISFGTSDCKGFLGRLESKRLRIYMSGNGSSWNIYGPISNDYQFTENEWYYFKFYYDGTYFKVDSSSDGENWENRINNTKTFQIYTNNQPIYLGYRYSYTGEYWRGSINLDECYIKVNNQYIWQGNNLITDGIYNTGCFISKDEGWTNFAGTNVNYLRTVNNFNPGTNSWEIGITFTTGDNITTEQAIISGHDNYFYNFSIMNGKFAYWISSNGSSWNIANNEYGSVNVKPNTTYFVNLVFDYDNSLYRTVVQYDDVYGIEDYTKSCTIYGDFNNFLKFGLARSGSTPFYGSISIKQTKIYLDNNIWFYGPDAELNVDYNIIGNMLYNSTSNIVTRFNSSSYLQFNPIEKNSNKNRFTGITRVYFVQTTQPQDIITRSSGADRCWCMQASNSSNANRLDFYNGSSHMSKTTFQTNNWYWVAFTWNSQTYKFYSMLDNGRFTSYKELPSFDDSIWTLETSYNDTNNLYETGFVMGYNVPVANSNRYWRGAIDLNNCIFGNNIIKYSVEKEHYISQRDLLTINEDTTESSILPSGITLYFTTNTDNPKFNLYANGYQQIKNTNFITAEEDTEIFYKITNKGYKSLSGSCIMPNGDNTLYFELEETSIGDDPQWTTGSWRDITPDIIPAEYNAIRGKTGTCTSYSGDINRLTNGVLRDSTTGFAINSNAVLTYNFDEPVNIFEIRIYSIWQDTGRDRITIKSITYNDGNEIKTIPNSAINYEPGSNYGYAYLKDSDSSMLIAENVISININFGEQENGSVGYSEIEIRKEL